MSKGTAIISIMVAFFGGAIVGNLLGNGSGGSDDGDSLAALGAEAADIDGVGAIVGEAERVKVPVTEDQPIKGAADALVTIVEISDFECPFCSRVNPTIKEIMDTYKDKVRVVWRNNPLPFHKNAPLAHQAAMEAFDQKGSEGFWQYHDKLFADQKNLTRENLDKWAGEVGLNAAEFKKALDSGEHKAKIDADQALAAKIGARGTPHFVINGRKLSGAQPFAAFKTVIDEEIAAAEKLLAKGASKEQLYATFLAAAADSPAPEQPAAGAGARPQPDPKAVYNVPVGDEPSKGSKDALVTIVEVSDFECPFCSRVNPTIKQIMDTYGKDVRVVWYNNPLPFHKNAPLAHQAALEVFAQKGDAAFWKYHDKLFENQKALTPDNLETWAKELGVNVPKFKKALETNVHKATIDKQQQLAASRGARGTPAFFINGRFLSGAQPFPAFKSIIDEELTKAKALVASGTPRGQVYAKIVAKGATSPQMLAGAQAEAPKPEVYNIPVPKDAPSKGASNAKVVIQEFSDFQCPFCSRVNPTMKQVMDEYGSKVKVVWRNYPLPFHKDAPLAHQAAWEVYKQKGDAAFWKYHDLLFENQKELTRENLEKLAGQIGGVNMGAFKTALDTQKHKGRMDEDMAAVTKAGARIGTPSFFINGKLVQGAQPFPAFKAAIDEALSK